MLHIAAAQFLQADELSVTEEEAQQLSKAIVRVSQLYDIGVMGEKAAAWTQLGIACATIYGPRALAVSKRKKENADAVQQRRSTVRSIV